MTFALAGMIGSTLLLFAGIAAAAAVSHCPRRVRVWPLLLVGVAALALSDRTMMLLGEYAPLHEIRAWVSLLGLVAAAATVTVLSWTITVACPVCRGDSVRAPRFLAAHINKRQAHDEHEGGLPL